MDMKVKLDKKDPLEMQVKSEKLDQEDIED